MLGKYEKIKHRIYFDIPPGKMVRERGVKDDAKTISTGSKQYVVTHSETYDICIIFKHTQFPRLNSG